MGHMNAIAMKESVDEGLIDLDNALIWHLQHNHYPPINSDMIETCKEAIQLANDDEWDAEVSLPEGVAYYGQEVAPVRAIIEDCHLDSFLDCEEE